MIRLPAFVLVLLTALLVTAATPTDFQVAGTAEAGIHKADGTAAPQLFKPGRVEHLRPDVQARPSHLRFTLSHATPSTLYALGLLQAGRMLRSPQLVVRPEPVAGLGAPRFPTGPPRA